MNSPFPLAEGWKGWPQAARDAAYDNLAGVPDSAAQVANRNTLSVAFRAAHAGHLDLPFGAGEREKWDLYPAARADAPCLVFIHGGYWQALDRSFASHCARGLLGQGVAVAVPSYDLCPAVTLGEIAEQMRRAAAFLHRRRGGRLLAAGHSAGGQLAALLLATDWPAWEAGLPAGMVGAALPISGVFELGPLRGTSIGQALRLTGAEIATLSPRLLPPPAYEGLHVVVGGAESDEFIRQSRDFATHWGGSFEALPGANHFTVLDPFAGTGTTLAAQITSAIISISTQAPRGMATTPKALRACSPAAPNTCASNSLQPLVTRCCSLNSGVEQTRLINLTMRLTLPRSLP